MGQEFTPTEVAADQTVGVLIASPLRGTEGMAIVDRQRERMGSGELRAIVHGDALEGALWEF